VGFQSPQQDQEPVLQPLSLAFTQAFLTQAFVIALLVLAAAGLLIGCVWAYALSRKDQLDDGAGPGTGTVLLCMLTNRWALGLGRFSPKPSPQP
jgi:hypothetical protein